MKLWVCTDHDYYWPVGCASVVWAATEEDARKLLDAALIEAGLKNYSGKPYTLDERDISKPGADVLATGNY
jgi:hypothetical protein